MMIDTLLNYGPTTREATREEILAELEELGFAREGELDSSRAMWVELIASPGTYDEEGNVLTPRVVLPGLALWICTPTVDDDLWNLPGNVARLQADRDAHAAGELTWLIRTRVDPGAMSSILVSPSYMGADYPFGAVT